MAVFFKATSEFDDVLKDYDKLAQKVTTLEQKNKELAKGVKEGGDESESFFKSQTAGIVSTLAGWVSIEGAIRLVGSALQFAQDETDQAVASMETLADSRRRLAQVTDSGKDLDRDDKRADELAIQFGVDRGVVRGTMFGAKSLGAEDAVPSILKYSSVLDPEMATMAAGKLPAIFEGEINSEQALALGHMASKDSALNFEDFMGSLPTAAQGTKAAGGSAAEASALISVLSEGVADKTQAGNLIKAFGVKVGIDSKDTFTETRGIKDAAKQLELMPEEKRRAFLGDSQEMNVAYKMITEKMEKIEAREAKVQFAIDTAGTDQSPLEKAHRSVFDQSTDLGRKNIAGLKKRSSEIRRDVIREDNFGESGSLADAAIATGVADLDEAGTGSIGKYGGMAVGKTAKLFQAPESFIEGATKVAGVGMSELFGFGSYSQGRFRNLVQSENERVRAQRSEAAIGQAESSTATPQEDKQLAAIEKLILVTESSNETLKQMNTSAAGAAGNRETR